MRQDRKNSAWSTGLWPQIKSSGPPTSHTREQGSQIPPACSRRVEQQPRRDTCQIVHGGPGAKLGGDRVVITPAAAGNSGGQASPDDATQS